MKAGWEVRALGELLEVQNGFAFPSPEFCGEGGTPLIRIRDLKSGLSTEVGFSGSYDPAYLVHAGDFLIGMDGEFRCYEWQGAPSLLNQRVCRLIKFSPSLLPRYLYYGINKFLKDIEDITSFTTVKHLSSKTIKAIRFPLPPLEEQQQIVAVLDEALEGLTRARAHAETNLQNARELFTLELKEIFSEGKDGWTKAKIEDLCTIRSGTTVSKALERASGDVPYVKVADMNLAENLEGIVTSTRFLSIDDVPDRQIIRAGATIFPKRGGAILTNKKRKVLVDICADLNVMGVIPGAKIDEDFLHHYFLSIDMRDIGSGSSIPQINNYDINPMMLSFPPDRSQQAEVADGLQLLRDKTSILSAAYRTKLSDIDALRQSLLQKAFAGELT